MKTIFERKVIICAGTGGVGKTTVAASLGLLAAREGRKALVLTIDPARRLATSLGLDLASTADVEVPGTNGLLSAAVVHHEKGFERFIREASASPEVANKVLGNLLVQQLSTQFSGSQEFTSLDRLLRGLEEGGYDQVILDTPPAQHAMDFLQAPQKIYALFQQGITRWFVEPERDQGLVRKILSRGTHTVLSALERITGKDFMSELSDFFEVIRHVQEKISERSIQAQKLLSGPDVGFVLVSGIDSQKIREAQNFNRDLQRLGMHLSAVIVNRAYPTWFTPEGSDGLPASDISAFSASDQAKLQQIHSQFSGFYRRRTSEHRALRDRLRGAVRVLFLPNHNQDIHGLTGLNKIADEIKASYNETS